MRKITLLVLWLALPFSLFAQREMVMPFMDNVAQASYSNVTLMNDHKVSLGLPFISSNYFLYGNNSFSWRDITYKQNGFTFINPGQAVAQTKRSNYIYSSAAIDLLSLRIKAGSAFWMLNVTEHVTFQLAMPKDVYTLLWYGNGGFADNGIAANFKGLRVDANHYREIGLGYTRPTKDNKFVIGGRAKVLFGLENAHTERTKGSIITDGNNAYATTVGTDYRLNISTGNQNVNDVTNGTTNYDPVKNLSNWRNPGAGLDLGLTYNSSKSLSFTALANNFGFISWKTNVKNYSGKLNTTNFSGAPINGIVVDGDATNTEAYGDTLKARFTPSETNQAYTTWLTPQYYLMSNYKLNKYNRVGGALFGEFYSGLRSGLTLNYTFAPSHWFNALVNYTMQNRSFDNVGLGLVVKPGPVQFYAAADNVVGIMLPTTARCINLRAGINFVSGNLYIRDRDGDGVPDKNDRCPDTPGPKNLLGCPDTDKDGLADLDDVCPTQAGPIALQGCPDRDGDLVADRLDSCPDVAGLVEMNGCPDRDGDGIIDKKDLCPDTAGTAQCNGCPDRDNDGVADKLDKCPDAPGLAEHHGCPDTDGDGVFDDVDACIKEAGPADNKGCPYGDRDKDGTLDKDDRCPDEKGPADNQGCLYADADKDGVVDKVDQCPLTPGPASNNGCPVLQKEEVKVLNTAFSNLEFETGKDVIKATSFNSLNELANLLVNKPSFKLRIAGHTDNVGKPANNMTLSRKRATAVKDYLVRQGVDASRFVVQAFGQTKPVASNTTEAGRKKNRRVEMKVMFD